MGSIAMTALIGRVPIDGSVNDPYPFKVLIGPDNLTANGIDIPDVASAVVSGTASGDWTLSCVRGQIRSVTFAFHDGTIRTEPEDGGRNSNRQQDSGSGNSSTQDGLGWISDPYGIPCVSGERRPSQDGSGARHAETPVSFLPFGYGVAFLAMALLIPLALLAWHLAERGVFPPRRASKHWREPRIILRRAAVALRTGGCPLYRDPLCRSEVPILQGILSDPQILDRQPSRDDAGMEPSAASQP